MRTGISPPTLPLRRYGASIILVFVAISQILLANAYDLCPWKGGGFGMFASTDDPESRFFRVFITGEDGQTISVPVPDSLSRIATNAKVLPTTRHFEKLAHHCLNSRWVTREGKEVTAHHVRIEFWKTTFDRKELSLTARLLHTFSQHRG